MAAATLLAAPLPLLLIAPADATGDAGARTDHPEAKPSGELLTVRVVNWLASFGGLRTGPWRSLEEEEPEEIGDVDRDRWRDWTWSGFARSGAGHSTKSSLWDAFAVRTTHGAGSRTGTAGPVSVGSGRVRWPQEGSHRFDDGPSPVLTLSLQAGIRLEDAGTKPMARFEPETVSGLDTN